MDEVHLGDLGPATVAGRWGVFGLGPVLGVEVVPLSGVGYGVVGHNPTIVIREHSSTIKVLKRDNNAQGCLSCCLRGTAISGLMSPRVAVFVLLVGLHRLVLSAQEPSEELYIPSLSAPADVSAPPSTAVRSESGLASRVLVPAPEGAASVGDHDEVIVHYTGWTARGERFTTTRDGSGRVSMWMDGQMLDALREGIGLMRVGEHRRLWIPEDLAVSGRTNEPAGPVVFDVQLIESTAPFELGVGTDEFTGRTTAMLRLHIAFEDGNRDAVYLMATSSERGVTLHHELMTDTLRGWCQMNLVIDGRPLDMNRTSYEAGRRNGRIQELLTNTLSVRAVRRIARSRVARGRVCGQVFEFKDGHREGILEFLRRRPEVTRTRRERRRRQ